MAVLAAGSMLVGLTAPAAIAQPVGEPGASGVNAAEAELSIRKEASRTTVQPGQEFQYTLTAGCSTMTTPCLDMMVTDTLPAEFHVSSLPHSDSQRDIDYNATTRVLTVAYKVAVAGGTGLPAGSSQQVAIGMRLPAQTPVTDGTVIPNTATVTASNAVQQSSHVDVAASIPVTYEPVATKEWTPRTAVALSQETSQITLGVRNASTSSAQVRELIVADTSQNAFDRFDLQAPGGVVGQLTQFPQGANQAYVDVCLLPLGTPCADGDWVTSGPFTSTGDLTAPAGDMTTATGIRVRFSADPATDLPYSATRGLATFTFALRDTLRSNAAPIEPTTREKVTNCASPSAADGGNPTQTYAGPDACTSFSILPGTVALSATKSMFPDNNGTFGNNGHIVVGQDSGVSMKVSATNEAAFKVGEMTITEPSATAISEFDKIDATNVRLFWPAGAAGAELRVTCRSGADPAPQVFTRPGGNNPTTNVANLGCDPGVYPEKIEVAYTGLAAPDDPRILPDAVAALGVHGTARGVTQQDVSNQLLNCADARSLQVPGGSTSAVVQACTTAPVQNPTPGIGGEVKTSSGVTSMALCPNPGSPAPGECEPVSFRIGFRNTGNVPVANVVITDGQGSPTGSAAPFDKVRLDRLSLPGSPSAVAEVWDPTAGGTGGYVPYDAGDAVLLGRATGFRVSVTGNLPVGAGYNVTARVIARDTVIAGETFTNCASMTLGSTTRQACADSIVVGQPNNNAQLEKLIVPGQATRPAPGLPAQKVQVRQVVNTAAGGGNLPLKRLITTDVDTDFFDAVTFAGGIHINFPVGANRVQIDACTSVANCQGDIWVDATPTGNRSPGLPGGVQPAEVKGIRVTFTHSSGGYLILPSSQIPSSSQCRDAHICFDVIVKDSLPADVDLLENSITGAGESQLQPPGTTFPIPEVTAPLSVVAGTAQLAMKKSPNTRIGPSDTAPINLKATNSGTSLIHDPVVVDPLPAELTVVPGVGGAAPYTIRYNNLPTGYPKPTTVTNTEIRGDLMNPPTPGCTDANRICALRWEFPGYQLPVGASIEIQFTVELTPGTPAQTVISNVAGTSASNQSLTCKNPAASQTGAPYGTGLYCLDGAEITSLSGNDFTGEKWIKADPSLGFLDASGQAVGLNDPQCPRYFYGGDVYTRYPCVARVLPGQKIDYLLRGVNSGTNPATEVVVLDGLPVQGDNGVKLTGQMRGTEWNNRPTMLTPVVSVENHPAVTTGYTDSGYTTAAFCRNGIKPPGSDTCPPGSFSASFGPANTGFQTTLTFPDGRRLDPGDSFTLTWSMRAPATLTSTVTDPVAWNSFAYRPSFLVGGSTIQTLPSTEPLKVGVAMPMESFTVNKEVVGLPQGVTVPPFTMSYRCNVDTEDSGEVESGSGTFTVQGGQSWTSPLVPAGSACFVWETDPQGGTSDTIGEQNAAVIAIVAGGDNTTVITNSYDAGELTLRKTVTVAVSPAPTVGPFTVEVDCGFPKPGDTLPGYPLTATLDDGDSTTLTDLPVGTSCQITETDTQGATKVIISPSNQAPTVGTTATVGILPTDQGGTRVEVNNVFETGGILIDKQLVGEGSAWADGAFEFDIECTLVGNPTLNFTAGLSPSQLSTVVSPIPAGYECTITETSGGNAAVPLPGPVVVTIPDYPVGGTPPGPVKATFVNEFPVNLRLTKDLSGDAARWAQGPFTFEISCNPVSTPDPVVVTLSPTTLVADVSGLPTGALCDVTETTNGGASLPVVPFAVGSFTVAARGNAPVELDVTNEFPEARIRVAKTLSGTAASRMIDAEFPITIVCERDLVGGGTEEILNETVKLKGGQTSQWFANLPRGARCWASERNSLGAASVSISHDTSNPVTLTDADPDATITVDNNYPTGGNENGSLVITKNLTGDAAKWAQGPFEFETKCSVGGFGIPSVTSVLTPNTREGAIKNLPVGASCVVQEKTVGSASMPQPNVVGFATVPDVSTQDVSVDPAYVPAVNDFPAGYITLAKSTDGAAAESMSGARFVLDVRCERDLIAGGTEEILASEVTLGAGESIRLDNDPMPVDARCWATEIDSNGATAVSVDHGPANPLTIQIGEPEVTIRAVNTFDAGSIQLVKTLSGEAAKYGEGPFNFTVSCTLGGVDVPQQTVSLTPQNLKATITGLPVGAVCAVHEVSAGNASVALPRLVATVTVPPATGTPVVVEVDNPFPAGRVTVSKEVRGGAAHLTGRAKFRIRVVCEFRDERVLREAVTLRAGKSKTLSDPLPMGTQCWGQELGDTGAGKASVSPKSRDAAVPVSEEHPAVTITATNTFTSANLRVRKKVRGASAPHRGFGFTVRCTMGKGKDEWQVGLSRRHRKFMVHASNTHKVVVPAGSKCTVKETEDRKATKTTYSKRGGKATTKKGRVRVTKRSGLVVVTNTFPNKVPSRHGLG